MSRVEGPCAGAFGDGCAGLTGRGGTSLRDVPSPSEISHKRAKCDASRLESVDVFSLDSFLLENVMRRDDPTPRVRGVVLNH